MNSTIWNRVIEYLKKKIREKRWRRLVTCMAGVVAFITTYVMILPAITMTAPHPVLTAEALSAGSGEELTFRVTAEAPEGEKEKIILLAMENLGEGADLSPSYVFDQEGICLITEESGHVIELHRTVREVQPEDGKTGTGAAAERDSATNGEKGSVDYWFVLQPGETADFTLDLLDETDSGRFAKIVEAVKEAAEQETEKAAAGTAESAVKATDSDAEKASASNASAQEYTDVRTSVTSGAAAAAGTATAGNAQRADLSASPSDALGEEMVERHDDGFVELLDGGIENDLTNQEDGEDAEKESGSVLTTLTVFAGMGDDFSHAVRDVERNAEKRGDAKLVFTWTGEDQALSVRPELTAKTGDAVISVLCPEGTQLPADAWVDAVEIRQDSLEYESYVSDAADAVAENAGQGEKSVTGARFFDITIRDAAGNEIRPEGPVEVIITCEKPETVSEEEETRSLVHFGKEGAEVVDVDEEAGDGTEEAVKFTAESFSVYGVVYTVDFHYDFNGKSYEFTIPGGGAATLEQILEAADLTNAEAGTAENGSSASAEKVLANITDVKFSRPEVLWVGKTDKDVTIAELREEQKLSVRFSAELTEKEIEEAGAQTVKAGDWALISVRPFAEEEKLTVTMANGDYFTLKVTDDAKLQTAAVDPSKPLWEQHAVGHMDLSISTAAVQADVPLAYGKYYDENHEVVLEVNGFRKLHLGPNQVADMSQLVLTEEDLSGAVITAALADGTEVENTYQIIQESGTTAHETAAGKVRLNGAFKVADLDTAYADSENAERLSKRIYYTVSLMKPVSFNVEMEDPENPSRMIRLYDADGNPLTITADVEFSAGFDFWNEENECPVVKTGSDWQSGGIPQGDTAGLDFTLGGAETSTKTYAIEITKIVVDENGHRIKSEVHSQNPYSFSVFRKDSTDGSEVKDLNIGSFTETPDYSEYSRQHGRDLVVGNDGLGITYDYDVTPGLYYVKENPESIPDKITDTAGKEWTYRQTYILTEYAWRNHSNDNYMHVSDTFTKKGEGEAYTDADYSSVPEILGDHIGYSDGTIYTNDFLEFFVYNVYESPKADVPVEKAWPDFEADDYDWTASFKLQWAPLYPGENIPNASFLDVSPERIITISKDQMKDEAAKTASLDERTFKDLPKYGTDASGNTFRYQYSLEEISYRVTNSTTGVILYSWSHDEGYNDPDEDTHYHPFYLHDAGEFIDGGTEEESAADGNYYISVSNAKRNITSKEYIDVSLFKQWDETFGNPDDTRWAEFELRRYVRTEHRDLSHMSDADRTAKPVTVTVKDGSGNVIHTMQVQPNVGLFLGGMFRPHDDAKTVTFTSDSPVRLANDSRVSSIAVTAQGSNMSNALVRSPEFFVTTDTVFTLLEGEENLIDGEDRARVLDTMSGTAPVPDRTFSQTIRLDSTNNWKEELAQQIYSETSAGDDDDNENVTFYEYYFVEKDSSPKGYAQYYRADTSGNKTETQSGDADHRVVTDESVIALNGPSNRLIVKKLWRGVPDTTGFPAVTFTLYQTWEDDQNGQGWIYRNEEGTEYKNIELKGNALEWICPEVLPVTRPYNGTSRNVKYYVMEDVRTGSYSEGGITTSWQFYYYINSDGKQYNAGHQGHNVALTGQSLAQKGGTITICNKMNAYMQLDIQKQFFKLQEAGSWNNVTANSDMMRNAVLGFKVIRAVKTSDGKWLDEAGNESVSPVWLDYSEEMLCGYDANGNAVVQRGQNDLFWLHNAGGNWHFRIEDNQGDANNVNVGGSGLPSYGFFIRNGQEIPVEYWYSCRETNVYKDINRTPYPEWDWFSSITPVNAYGPGGSMEAFPKAFHGQDPKRIANFQASDIFVDKQWIGEPGAQEVYVKLWRVAGDNGTPEDFTAVIAEDIRENRNWQMFVNNTELIDLKHDCLILKPDENGKWEAVVKVNRALLGSLAETGLYHYYIQEIGYKSATGEYRTNVNAKFKPLYDKWVDGAETGRWTDAPVPMNAYAGNNIKIGAKGENKLRVINRSTPSTSYTITKAFHGPQSSTGGQSSVTGKYPTDGSKQVVVELQQRYRFEKTENDILYVSADNENWVRADLAEAANVWTVGWQGAESADPTSVVLPLDKPAGSVLSDKAWYGSAAAWSYTWEGLDVVKVLAEDADPTKSRMAQLYYRAVETSTPGWFNSFIATEEQDGHRAIDDDEQTAEGIRSEKNTVTNERGDCELVLNKEWTGLGEGQTWPDDVTIDYQLIQHLHLSLADMSKTEEDEDGRTHIVPEYTVGKTFKSIDMTTSFDDAGTADSVHTQAIGRNIGRPADGSTVIADITGLPMFGFYTVTEADVETAAEAGVTLVAGKSYPVVYTYSAKETSVKKNGVEIPFKAQTVEAEVVSASQDGVTQGASGDAAGTGDTAEDGESSDSTSDTVKYTAKFTNELVSISVEKVWNGLTPGESESATIQLRRFKKEIEPEPEKTFKYTVSVTGTEEALSSDGTVTVTVYDENGTAAGSCVLRNGAWSHTFELEQGGTYSAEFSADGTALESVSPAADQNITGEKAVELTAGKKPAASGSVKLVVTGSPNSLWINPLMQYIDGVPQNSTAQNWGAYFNGSGGETITLTGLIPGAEYRFQIGAAPSSVENASYSNGYITFTASDGLTVITMNYGSGESGGGSGTTTGRFSGSSNYWGINDWNHLTVGQNYAFIFQVGSDPTSYYVSASGVSAFSFEVTNNWGSGGQITVTFVPASADQEVIITALQSGSLQGKSLMKAGKRSAAPLRVPAQFTWTTSSAGLPKGADPDQDEVVDTVVLSGSTWSKTWSEQPKYSADGMEYVYYAYETAYTGAEGATAMETTYSVDENGKVTVTNTPTFPEAGNLKVVKQQFYHGALNTGAGGRSFTVGLFQDAAGQTRVPDTQDQTFTVSNGTGEVTFTGLPAGTYYVFEIVNGSPVTSDGTQATINGVDYTVTYTGNPAAVSAGQTAEVKVINDQTPFELNLLKVDRDNHQIMLDGAEFALNRLVYNPETGVISYEEGSEKTVTTADGGKATFKELALGYYEIKETKAPEGYSLTGEVAFCIRVTDAGIKMVQRTETGAPESWVEIESSGLVTFKAESNVYTATVENEPGITLPSTGGPGTAMIHLIGLMLTGFAGCGFLVKRLAGF